MTEYATISFRTYKNHHLTERMLHNKMRAGVTGDLSLTLETTCISYHHKEAGVLVSPTGVRVGILHRVSEIPAGVEKGVRLPVELIDYNMKDDTWLFTVSV
jgi:hypothetical protein